MKIELVKRITSPQSIHLRGSIDISYFLFLNPLSINENRIGRSTPLRVGPAFITNHFSEIFFNTDKNPK
jgi:hypothetical protein